MQNSDNKPCPVQNIQTIQAEQGLCVKYKEKFLYSKYAPQKNILGIINSLTVLPGTLFLCVSPVLPYGLEELAKKCGTDSVMLAIEAEPELYSFMASSIQSLECAKNGILRTILPNELFLIPKKIQEEVYHGKFRRVIQIDFSAGSIFHQEFYKELFEATRNTVSQFWKNRITLVKFGRKYSANLFKNLPQVQKQIPLIKTQKPILVIGAGESAFFTAKKLLSPKDFFIIVVDVAVPFLRELNIFPDVVICEESQSIIARAFTGSKNMFKALFLSSTVCPAVARIPLENKVFYTPLFADCAFLKTMIKKQILKNPQEPLGSVGLSAVKAALSIRNTTDVPIFVTGLDFSYSPGKTHVKNSLHDFLRRTVTTKTTPLENWSASFSDDAKLVIAKNGESVITTTPLSSYRNLFEYIFKNEKNLFDAGKTGLPFGIPKAPEDFYKTKKAEANNKTLTNDTQSQNQNKTDLQTKDFIKNEKNALCELKDLLTGKAKCSNTERTSRIQKLLTEREYLYLHFPDGYEPRTDIDFLKRVRMELDYFLRIFDQVLPKL